eukprot:648121-Pleurochrysis_carterae.AAC.1
MNAHARKKQLQARACTQYSRSARERTQAHASTCKRTFTHAGAHKHTKAHASARKRPVLPRVSVSRARAGLLLVRAREQLRPGAAARNDDFVKMEDSESDDEDAGCAPVCVSEAGGEGGAWACV